MRSKFGRTWWGEQWLGALDKIDFDNRLERGRRYANNGSVKTMEMDGSIVLADVQGSRRKPYSVRIEVPEFSEAQKELLVDTIAKDPLLISRLLNRELPEEVLKLATKKQIPVFPKTWKDIRMACSCPDWAVPCKHLAAVVYLIGNEIDRNPFVVFALHGLDLVAGLTERGVEMASVERERITAFPDLATRKKPEAPFDVDAPKQLPDLSDVTDLTTTLPNLFPADALFYSGNMQEEMQRMYKRFAKGATSTEVGAAKIPATDGPRYADYDVTFAPLGAPVISVREKDDAARLTITELIEKLQHTGPHVLDSCSPSFIALYRTWRVCNALAKRGAVLPKFFHCSDSRYRMLWQPAVVNQGVRTIIEQLTPWLPDDMVLMGQEVPQKEKAPARAAKKAKKPTKKASGPIPVDQAHAATLLCSLFFQHAWEQADPFYRRKESGLDAKVLNLFFSAIPVAFNGVQELEVPNTIQLWLGRSQLGSAEQLPVISVSEVANGFEVDAMVQANDKLHTLLPLRQFLKKADMAERLQVLKNLNLLSSHYPDLDHFVRTEGREPLHYPADRLLEVLTNVLPVLQLFGIPALLPKSLQMLALPRLALKMKGTGANTSYFNLQELIQYDWQVAMGDTFISKAEFEALAEGSMGLVKIREQYLRLDPKEVERILKQLEKPAALNAHQLLQAALSGETEHAKVQIDDRLRKQMQALLNVGPATVPSSLKADLRPYQHRGFDWLQRNAKLGFGSLLADDMGLGKTIQVIAMLLQLKHAGALDETPALVIVPTTLLTNWAKEIERFAPDLRSHIYHGPGRKMPKKVDVLITTYGMARSDSEKLGAHTWPVLVIDEAQNIKNPVAAQTKAIKKIKADTRIALSGTPVENRLSEYWSIMDFVNPGYLGGLAHFDKVFAKPIEIQQDQHVLDRFRRITSPFILRRLKTDKSIISDLPDKVENDQFCHLSKEQAALYQNVTKDLMALLAEKEGIERRGLVLKLLTLLKQVCNHPAQFLKNKELEPELSGKLMMLLHLLETIQENNEKVLIFSQYREMGDILAAVIRKRFNKEPLQLHGGNSRKQRDEMVRSFQESHRHDIFILSLKAGGTGLNLTAAANVIHYDLWWNPAVEAQATDRAFRIGQKQNVMVHRLITKGTLEERIDAMIRGKRDLANMTVGTGEKWIGELSDTDLKELVELG